MQLTPARYLELVGAITGLYPQRHIVNELSLQTLLQITRGHILPLTPCKGGVVDLKSHTDSRLVDRQCWQCLRLRGIAQRVGYQQPIDTRHTHNIASVCRGDFCTLKALIAHDLKNFARPTVALSVDNRDRCIAFYRPSGHAANANHTHVTRII